MKKQGLGTGDWGLGCLLGMSIALMSGQVGFADDPLRNGNDEELRITVRLQDYAQVPRGMLAGAKQEATRVLKDAGIEVAWLNCQGPAGVFTADSGCTDPFAPTDLLLRVLPRSMAERVPFTDSTFGFALQSTDDRRAFVAGVFAHRVRELSEALGDSPATILGLVMAHEIGHLLLNTTAHSPTGIMRARLNREDLLRPLGFTWEQQNLLRDDVSDRLRLQEARPAAEVATSR